MFEENQNHFKGIKISRTSPAISHLLYDDDLLIFCRATKEDVESINGSLHKFSLWSSHIANPSKSLIHFSKNTPPQTKIDNLNILNFKDCDDKAKIWGFLSIFKNPKKPLSKSLMTESDPS